MSDTLGKAPIVFVEHERARAGRPGRGGNFAHSFGGPLDLEVLGHPPGQRPLHRVLTLDLADPALGMRIAGLTRLPLLYGFVFDGCALSYEIAGPDTVRIRSLTPRKSCDDWPYEGYPPAFARVPIELSEPLQVDADDHGSLSAQGIELRDRSHVAVVVRSCPEFGVSLWGEDADGFVDVVFVVDAVRRVVTVENQCD